ncbi:hypothetical protein Pa4123_81950 [Phytohabitans aurantiacus]|uniref:Ankyrin repeat domain-containing protein n=1 Tax=Phytohabitans aurantiacus TaxID=3016789 RepID=A0ABQ5R9U3_9ACTN|nr:hypothetical protein Pa4123_81950 [Phytohabitans aurantiacus]
MGDWDGVRLWGGGDVAQVREQLAAGSDPCELLGGGYQTMLHSAVGFASPDVVEAMAGAARTLDLLVDGRSALWVAVYEGRHDNARVLAAAGADPWLAMMAGWSPGRLSLAGSESDLFSGRPADARLTRPEAESVATALSLRVTLTEFYMEGTGLPCVAGIDTAEAIRRLDGTSMSERELPAHYGATWMRTRTSTPTSKTRTTGAGSTTPATAMVICTSVARPCGGTVSIWPPTRTPTHRCVHESVHVGFLLVVGCPCPSPAGRGRPPAGIDGIERPNGGSREGEGVAPLAPPVYPRKPLPTGDNQ